jgi:hypothetical protein
MNKMYYLNVLLKNASALIDFFCVITFCVFYVLLSPFKFFIVAFQCVAEVHQFFNIISDHLYSFARIISEW